MTDAYWNYERPHQGIGYLYPADVFFRKMWVIRTDEVNNMDEAQRENLFCSGAPYRFIREDGTDSGIECRSGLEGLALGLLTVRVKDPDLYEHNIVNGNIFSYIEGMISKLPDNDPIRMQFNREILDSSKETIERYNAFQAFMGRIRHFWKEVYTHDEARGIIMDAIRTYGPKVYCNIRDPHFVRQLNEVTAIFDRKFAPRLGLAADRLNPDRTIIDADSPYYVVPLYLALRYGAHVIMLTDFALQSGAQLLIRWLLANGFLRERVVTVTSDFGAVNFALADGMYYCGTKPDKYTINVRKAFLFYMRVGSKLALLYNDRHRFPKECFEAEDVGVTSQDITNGDKYHSSVFTKKVDKVYQPVLIALHFGSWGL
jgi:hypothetical protein